MKLYHGSPTGGITVLDPRFSDPRDPHIYLTDCPALAVIYAHSPVEGGYFPYFFDKSGQLCYEEYFPNALDLYKGFGGYVYTVEAEGLPQREKMPWAYKSAEPIPVTGCRHISDLYAEILRLGEAGEILITRYEELTEQKLAGIEGMLRREAEREDLRNHPERPYTRFYQEHFPHLL